MRLGSLVSERCNRFLEVPIVQDEDVEVRNAGVLFSSLLPRSPWLPSNPQIHAYKGTYNKFKQKELSEINFSNKIKLKLLEILNLKNFLTVYYSEKY